LTIRRTEHSLLNANLINQNDHLEQRATFFRFGVAGTSSIRHHQMMKAGGFALVQNIEPSLEDRNDFGRTDALKRRRNFPRLRTNNRSELTLEEAVVAIFCRQCRNDAIGHGDTLVRVLELSFANVIVQPEHAVRLQCARDLFGRIFQMQDVS
jgi:hypothetical protein